MKKYFNYLGAILLGTILIFGSCNNDDDTPDPPPPVDPGESTTELLVKKFTAAPDMDGNTLDDMWGTAQTLVGTTEVPVLDPRATWLNSDGEGVEEGLGLFFPYDDESNAFELRAGYYGDMVYFRMEWDDDADSKDRQSWYFDADPDVMLWKGEHKYANADNDKFYEDKFAFLFPIGDVDNFNSSTCYATCHGPSLPVANDMDKHTRHYLKGNGQLVDMWHWKRVRGTYLGQVDDQQMTYVDGPYDSHSNGRTGDEGGSGYSNNKQTLNNGSDDVSVPLYVIPNQSDYYWISIDDIDNGTAVLVTGVDENGILALADNTLLDPASGGYEQGTGDKRIPSVTTHAFTGSRADINISAVYTGTGWVTEFSRKLSTGNADDVVFDVTEELAFGLAIFDNAAIAHGIKPGLLMKFEQ